MNNTDGENLDSEEYCRQLLTQALELTQNENLRISLQQIIDVEFGGGSQNIDLTRLTTAEVCIILSSVSFLLVRFTKILLRKKVIYGNVEECFIYGVKGGICYLEIVSIIMLINVM